MSRCSVSDCPKPRLAFGYCNMHYKRWQKHGDPLHVTVQTPPSQKKHGHSWKEGAPSPEYRAWANMKHRCCNPAANGFSNYGGRGITVCERWVESFEAFLADMGPRPSPKYSLDRIDNAGNYEPQNCRWATATEQSRNRRGTANIPFDGRLVTVTELSEITGTPEHLLRNRLRRGWPLERAIQ